MEIFRYIRFLPLAFTLLAMEIFRYIRFLPLAFTLLGLVLFIVGFSTTHWVDTKYKNYNIFTRPQITECHEFHYGLFKFCEQDCLEGNDHTEHCHDIPYGQWKDKSKYTSLKFADSVKTSTYVEIVFFLGILGTLLLLIAETTTWVQQTWIYIAITAGAFVSSIGIIVTGIVFTNKIQDTWKDFKANSTETESAWSYDLTMWAGCFMLVTSIIYACLLRRHIRNQNEGLERIN